MKKLITLLIVFATMLCIFASCGSKTAENDRPTVAATTAETTTAEITTTTAAPTTTEVQTTVEQTTTVKQTEKKTAAVTKAPTTAKKTTAKPAAVTKAATKAPTKAAATKAQPTTEEKIIYYYPDGSTGTTPMNGAYYYDEYGIEIEYAGESDGKRQEFCEMCGKKIGDGRNGTCEVYINDATCEYCGVKVKAWECHSCK